MDKNKNKISRLENAKIRRHSKNVLDIVFANFSTMK